MSELKSERLFQNHDVDLVAQQHTQNRLTDRVGLLCRSHQKHQSNFDENEIERLRARRLRDLGAATHGVCHGVYEQAAYRGDRSWEHAND